MNPGDIVSSILVPRLKGKVLKILPDGAHAVVQCGRRKIVTDLKYWRLEEPQCPTSPPSPRKSVILT